METPHAHKLFYSIGEVAEMLQLTPSQIRFWEKEFKVKISHKNAKGNRMFTTKDIEQFRQIKHLLKEKGLTIAGAIERLKANPEKEFAHFEIIQRLQHIKQELLEIRSNLND